MDDAGVVGGLQRLGDLSRDWERLIDRDRALRDAVGEGRAFDELENERPWPSPPFSATP